VLHVLTVVCRDRRTVSAVVASTCHIAKSAKDIWKTIASMKYSATYARYIYKSYYFYTLPSCVFYIPVQVGLLFDISLSLHVVSSVCHRTVKNDALNDAPHSITSCLKLPYLSPDTTHPSKHLSTHVNTPSRTSFETPYSSTGTNAFVLL